MSRFPDTDVLVVLSVDNLPLYTYGAEPSSLCDGRRFLTLDSPFNTNHELQHSFFHM
jgi:hypothetical protein